MPARSIFEVRARTDLGARTLGFVTDEFIGAQVIDRLYNDLRQLIYLPDAQERMDAAAFPVGTLQEIQTAGWDQWSINNRNGPSALFYQTPQWLWNAVPSTFQNWQLVEVSDEFSYWPLDIPNTPHPGAIE
jgi:hypothetical protein